MKNTNKTKGIVLKRKDIGESDRLITIFSYNFGKIKVLARGTRKIKSKLAAHIEPFTIGEFHFVDGKTFYVLTGAERSKSIRDDFNLETYKEVSYVCELIDILYQEGEPSKETFETLSWTLRNLDSDHNHSLVLRYFELQLLTSLGYKPNLRACIKCQKPHIETDHYTGSFEGFYCDCCKRPGKRISKSTFKTLRLLAENDIQKIPNIILSDSCILELTEIVQGYLMEILPQKPKTLEL